MPIVIMDDDEMDDDETGSEMIPNSSGSVGEVLPPQDLDES